MRVVTAAILLCLIGTAANAAPIPCWQARAAVAWAGSFATAEALARQHGYTAREIAEARKCFSK